MNRQRSETGLNWCSADWGKSSITTRDGERRCDCTHSTKAVIGAGRRDAHEQARLKDHRGESRDTDGNCCIQRTGGDRNSGLLVGRRSGRLCQSCVGRGCGPDAGTGMAGRLTAGTTTSIAGPSWRQAKGSRQRGHGDSQSQSDTLHCLHRWMSTTQVFSRGWILYLFCYLILLNSSWSLSHALEDSRQSHHKSDGTKGNAKTVEEFLQRNFPERFNDSDNVLSEIQTDSSINNRVRLGRAGGKFRAASTNYNMKLIDQESARARCQPRDTVLDSYEELNIPKGYDIKVFPECIVVRRCKNGGCCRDDQECQPRSNGRHNVSKLFLINTRITTRYIEEDIDCECVEKPDFCPPPETDCPAGKIWSYGQCGCICNYRCPKPFLQDESTCACDCLTNNRICKNIQRGRKDQRIVAEECECIRRGMCGTPNCANGRFSTSKCKCVQEERRWS